MPDRSSRRSAPPGGCGMPLLLESCSGRCRARFAHTDLPGRAVVRGLPQVVAGRPDGTTSYACATLGGGTAPCRRASPSSALVTGGPRPDSTGRADEPVTAAGGGYQPRHAAPPSDRPSEPRSPSPLPSGLRRRRVGPPARRRRWSTQLGVGEEERPCPPRPRWSRDATAVWSILSRFASSWPPCPTRRRQRRGHLTGPAPPHTPDCRRRRRQPVQPAPGGGAGVARRRPRTRPRRQERPRRRSSADDRRAGERREPQSDSAPRPRLGCPSEGSSTEPPPYPAQDIRACSGG